MPTLRDAMTDARFHDLPLAAQTEVMRRLGADDDTLSAWVAKVSAATGEATLSQQTGPERDLPPEAQEELSAADRERSQRLRGTGWSEGPADAQDWKTLAKAVAFAAAPSAGAAAGPAVGARVAPFIPGGATVALRGGGAYQGQHAGAREAKRLGLDETAGRVAGGALGLAFPTATLVGEAAGAVSGTPGAAVPAALASVLLKKKLGPAGSALLRLLGVAEPAAAGAAAGASGGAAAAATRAAAASRVGLDMAPTVIPEAQAAAIASRLRGLYQTSGANKRMILEEGQRIFGPAWREVKKMILAPNTKIPVLLLGLGGAWTSGAGGEGEGGDDTGGAIDDLGGGAA